jgi:hypothetical protein
MLSLLRKVENSMIFICLTPVPKGEHLKIIELGSLPFLGMGVKDFSEWTQCLISNHPIGQA